VVAGRRVQNVHERALDGSPAVVGALVESLSSPGDRLWPKQRWPAMRLDHGLALGSDGGHGPVRYAVDRHDPGKLVAFAFTPAFPIAGEHRCEVLPAVDGRTLLRHTLEGRPQSWLRIGWPLCFRWLHDALIEDAFDRAEAQIANAEWRPRPLPAHVRLLRSIAGRVAGRR
jgi:hypothetical protein